ncbi:porin [Vibrio sp. SS-MA-C1-2]|uniref:porin n=1 Tax=Vibrio sp. SS-MA-C1-2 TaxID=2908646 RepID=UPI001F491980|nr:porin [Vibrio sp. SS-MA-C1-2]UJF18676.1 porin [Vibrio sp. SS-MA-C1-2]
MKKTLLALAVPAALMAGSAVADITLYDDSDSKVSISGAAEAQYRQAAVDKDSRENAHLRVADGDLAVNFSHQVNPDLAAIATFGIAIGEDDDYKDKTGVTADEMYAGLKSSYGTLTFGRQYLVADGAGIGANYENKLAGIDFQDTASDSYIKYQYATDQFAAAIGYVVKELDDLPSGTSSSYKYYRSQSGVDMMVRGFFGGFTASAFFIDGRLADNYDNGHARGSEFQGYDFELEWENDQFKVGALYGNVDVESSETDFWELAGKYYMGKNTLGLGIAQDMFDGGGDLTSYYVNLTHQLRKNVRAYGEVTLNDADNIDFKTAYALGLEVTF